MTTPGRGRSSAASGLQHAFLFATACALVALALAASPAKTLFAAEGVPPQLAEAQANFDRANELYRQGDYARAEELYRKVLGALPESAAARYNLGNALYRQGRAGAALQQYLAVLRRSPRDARARRNAEASRRQLVEAFRSGEHPAIAGPLAPPLSWLSRAEIAWLGVAALYVLAVAAALGMIRPRARPMAAVGAGLILLAAAAFGVAAARAWLLRPDAIVVASSSEARAGPSATEPAVLTLPEGAGLRVREERGQWVFVSLPNGLSGWIPTNEIGRIP